MRTMVVVGSGIGAIALVVVGILSDRDAIMQLSGGLFAMVSHWIASKH